MSGDTSRGRGARSSRPPADPGGGGFDPRVAARRRTANRWRLGFLASTFVGVIVLAALLFNVADRAFGYVAIEVKRDPESIVFQGTPLADLDAAGLAGLITAEVSKNVVRRMNRERPLVERSRRELRTIVEERIVEARVVHAWPLTDSLFRSDDVRRERAADYPKAHLAFRSWLTPSFVTTPQNPRPELAGVRTAILGSLWMIAITILFAFPVGVGAAVYLEEYARRDNPFGRLIQTNINNLAGVPSIIYGMLGLVILVRVLRPLTSGAWFGATDAASANGRTILSAGLTLGLLILPVLIINGQEAIRAVPLSLRQASYGLGATKWQTIWHHVLPSALPGVLTGTILAISRALGETAPIIVIGASTFLQQDPTGPFSSFTALPIQIYQWTSRPEDTFRSIAAAAILVLLALLLTLNATAVLLRNRYQAKG